MAIQLGSEEGPASSSKDGLELVTDAYYIFAVITYRWPAVLNEWHKNAVVPLIIIESLVRPDHPLRLPGKDGINLYTGQEADGKTRLYIHLKQVQFLQQYIYDHGLADPVQVIQRLRDEVAAGDSNEGAQASPQRDCVFTPEDLPNLERRDISGVSPWVPLPTNLVRASALRDIQEVYFSDPKELRKAVTALKKSQAHAQREARYDELGLTESQKQIARMEFKLLQEKQSAKQGLAEQLRQAKEAADIDNNTEGPGLWRGPRRQNSDRPVLRSDAEQDGLEDRPSGLGWGGFPVRTEEELQKMVDAAAAKIDDETASSSGAAASAAKPDIPDQTESPLSQADGPDGSGNVERATVPVDTNQLTSLEATTVQESPGVHFFHAQQALIIASQGGLATVLVETKGSSDSEDDDVSSSEEEEREILPLQAAMPIGRSLFVAFDFITWEEDGATLLEIGYAATWWQQTVDASEGQPKGTFEQIRENGHWIVQDHRLTKRNTIMRLDLRDQYAFGHSLPLEEKNIAATIKQTMLDLASKAGGGPIYVVVHSSDNEYTDLAALGLDTPVWQLKLKNDEEFPSYASPTGVGQTYVIDIAILFAVLESDQEVSPTEPEKKSEVVRTEKCLEEVADILLADRARFYGNAGNDAMYKLETFLRLVGPTELSSLKELVRSAGLRTAAGRDIPTGDKEAIPEEIAISLPDPPAGFVEFPLSDRQSRQPQPLAGESDSEDDMIAGVYYRNSDGELVEADIKDEEWIF